MKKLNLLLCLLLISLFYTNIYAANSSGFAIKFTGNETSIKEETKSKETKKDTDSNQIQKPTQPPTIYTGWLQIPNTNNWVYSINNQYVKGWYNVNGWYFFEDSYIMTTNKWIEYNGKWYYVGADGKMLVNANTPDGYYVNANGEWDGVLSTKKEDDSSSLDNTSKYLYKRAELKNGATSVTSSTKLGGETLKKNIIKLPNKGSIFISDTKNYNSLSFNYTITNPDKDNEYLLEIYINGELEEEITDFTSDKQEMTLEFDKNSNIQLIWSVETEDGSKTAKATTLYIYNGELKKVSATDD